MALNKNNDLIGPKRPSSMFTGCSAAQQLPVAAPLRFDSRLCALLAFLLCLFCACACVCGMSETDEERRKREKWTALESIANGESTSARWSNIPWALQRDKDVILLAIRKASFLPPKHVFERCFPQSLRFDKDVVLAFCGRSDFPEIYQSRHLFVPGCLQNDKDVMKAYCAKIPRALQEGTEEICDDPEVVRVAVARDGMELQYASFRLQGDEEMVRLACAKTGRAFELCPYGPLRVKLSADKDFMLHVLRAGGASYRFVSKRLLQDRDIVLMSMARGGMTFNRCPYEFQASIDFLTQVLKLNGKLYLEMNENLQNRRDLAEAAILSEESNPRLFSVIQEKHKVSFNETIAKAVIAGASQEFLESLIANGDLATDNKALMIKAVQRFPDLLEKCSIPLREDPEVLMVAIQVRSAAETLSRIPRPVQVQHPHLVERAVELVLPKKNVMIPSFVDPELWSNRVIALAWVKRGFPLFGRRFRVFMQDADFALAVAQYSPSSFDRIDMNLRSDRDFMIRAVAVNGGVLKFASEALKKDREMRIRAGASAASYLRSLSQEDNESLRVFMTEQTNVFDAYVANFLRGIAIVRPDTPPEQRSNLTMLNQGPETSQVYKKLIAEFAGVPTGKMARLMRAALANQRIMLTGQANETDGSVPRPELSRSWVRQAVRWNRQNLRLPGILTLDDELDVFEVAGMDEADLRRRLDLREHDIRRHIRRRRFMARARMPRNVRPRRMDGPLADAAWGDEVEDEDHIEQMWEMMEGVDEVMARADFAMEQAHAHMMEAMVLHREHQPLPPLPFPDP